MLILDDGDKLRGDASVASKLDYTIHGLDGATLKQLADGQLPAATGDIYTASAAVVVKTITIVNTDSVARTVNLFLLPSGGTARQLLPTDVTLAAGDALYFDGVKIETAASTGTLHASDHEDGGVDEIDATGLVGKVNYVDRGDPSSADFTSATLVADGVWRDLDLSGIAPAGTIAVELNFTITPTSLPGNLAIRKKGVTGQKNLFVLRGLVATLTHEARFFIQVDSSRYAQYQASAQGGGWTTLNITVCGWII